MAGLGGRSHVKRCHACRRRKVKCDGGTPACHRCNDHGIVCPGYERQLQFVFFDADTKPKSVAPKVAGGPSVAYLAPILRKHDGSTVPKKSSLGSRGANNIHVLDSHSSRSLGVSQSKKGIIVVLQNRYVPGLSSRFQGEGIGSSWIAESCSLAVSAGHSDMLSESLLAMSLSLISNDKDATDLEVSGLKSYSRALRGLRSGLALGALPSNDLEMDVRLVTCLCCGMYEMMANKSSVALMKHLGGVAAMLKARGVESLRSTSSRRTYYEYRAIYLPVALAYRQSNFVSLPEWQNPSWKITELHSSTHLQTLIDPAFRIPVLMEKFDRARGFIRKTGPADEWVVRALEMFLLQALEIQKAFDDWEERLIDNKKIDQLYIPRPTRPVESLEASGSQDVYSNSYSFPNWDIASGLSYYEMVQIYLNDFLIDLDAFKTTITYNTTRQTSTISDINTAGLTRRSILCADRICQSIEYYFEDQKKMIARMVILAPFQTAKGLFIRLSKDSPEDLELRRKVEFCDNVTRRIKDDGLPMWEE